MLGAVWPGAPGPPDRIPVIALASNSELSEFAGPQIAGLWIHRPPFPATIVTGGFFDGDRRQVLRHELAHHLSRWFLPQQPAWFSEGIASFLETIRYDPKSQRAVVGEPAVERHRTLRGLGMYPARRLLTDALPEGVELAQFEATSWLLVHYLINHRDVAFVTFQRRVGAFERPQDAWAAELGDLDADRLSTILDEYAASGDYTVLSIFVTPWTGTIAAAAMSDAAVHGARAFMYAATGRSRSGVPVERVRAEIAEALNADPAGTTEALAVQYYALAATTSLAQRRALADQASRAHPQTEMAWLMVADAAQLSNVRQTALSRALALAPNDAEVLARMALLKASFGKWDEAVAFSRKAVRLRAMRPQVLNLHVKALAHTGQCKEAAFYIEALSGPPVASANRASVLPGAWLELYEQCVQIAAERAKQRAELPVDGEGHGEDATH